MRCHSHCGGKVKRREHDPGYRSCRCGRIRILTVEERAARYKAAHPEFGIEIPTAQIESSYKLRVKAVWKPELGNGNARRGDVPAVQTDVQDDPVRRR